MAYSHDMRKTMTEQQNPPSPAAEPLSAARPSSSPEPEKNAGAFPVIKEPDGSSSASAEKEGMMARIFHRLLPGRKKRGEETLRDVLEGVIGDLDEDASPTIAPHERTILGNVLRLRGLSVADVMVPRADIVALEIDTPQQDVLTLIAGKRFSRYPVYRGTLDDVAGTIHIREILAAIAEGKPFSLKDIMRDALIVSPALPVMDLLLQMQHSGKHVVMVVDEYGGIDGLATISDIVQSIIGEIGDDRYPDAPPAMLEKPDGVLIADARTPIEDFEKKYGNVFSDAEDACDTLGGLVVALAGRVPARGEVVAHTSGIVFEIAEADPRRVRKLKLRNLPQKPHAPEDLSAR